MRLVAMLARVGAVVDTAGLFIPRPLAKGGQEDDGQDQSLGALAAAAGTLAAVGLLLLIMLVVLYAQPAEANYPGTNGKIAYSGWDGNDLEIYTINPDGGSNVKVTNNQSGNEAPAYSPNSKKIAYSGWDGQDWEIYTVNPDGGGRKNVTNNNTDDENPAYSPSGTKIAYSGRDANDWDIYTINPDGGQEKRHQQQQYG
jgi:hypothetical protein